MSSTSTGNPATISELKETLQKLLKKYNTPSGSVVAVRGKEIIFSNTFGMAVTSPLPEVPANENTIYLIASCSKLLTVMSILHLHDHPQLQKNTFSLEDDVNNFLPRPIQSPDGSILKFDFLQLMNHVSGIRDNYNILNALYAYYPFEPIVSIPDFVKWYFNFDGKGQQVPGHPNSLMYQSANFGPQGQFSYSNAGYTLLGYLVECISGSTLSDYCNEHILAPLGIGTSGEYAGRWHISELEKEIPIMARPNGNGRFYSFTGYPNGGFRCTGSAYARLLQILMNYGSFKVNGKTVRILKESTVKSITNFSDRNSPWETLTSYGFAFRTDYVKYEAGLSANPPQRLLIGHTGGETGVATNVFWINQPTDPSRSLGVVVLSNGDWPAENVGNGFPMDAAIAVLDHFQYQK